MLLFTTPWNSLNLSRLFHCSVIKVLCFVVVLGDSLFIISYQDWFVKNFFHFFERFSFNRFCPICYLKRDNSDILSCVVLFVKNFFLICCNFLNFHVFSNNLQFLFFTTRLYYQTLWCLSTTFSKKIWTTHIVNNKRRRRDLNPRAGYPTYTLSRGTSSATWVLLQSLYLSIWYCSCAVTHE